VVPAATAEAAAPAYTSDSLILYFKAEGTLEERAIPKITETLEVSISSSFTLFTISNFCKYFAERNKKSSIDGEINTFLCCRVWRGSRTWKW
jgi:hypothetical protein